MEIPFVPVSIKGGPLSRPDVSVGLAGWLCPTKWGKDGVWDWVWLLPRGEGVTYAESELNQRQSGIGCYPKMIFIPSCTARASLAMFSLVFPVSVTHMAFANWDIGPSRYGYLSV